ncbi:putative RNA-dependent RNA polymerase 1 [Termitomyces sp. T112]|nr:putative RNA-dependent RNA polymerase 1 [Termitomyces sp. T112]
MDIRIFNLPHEVNDWTVTRSIAAVVHSTEFTPRPRNENVVQRPINFKVKLNPSKAGGVRNDGSGTLTLPTWEIGSKFLRWVEDSPLKIEATLDKTPYTDPDIEEKHQQKLWDLSEKFRVNAVQFGVFYRPTYPSNDREPLKPRAFSVEWERRYDIDSEGWLSFEYDHKVIRITLGSEMTDDVGSSIAINFGSIQKIAVGYDGDPYICFDTLTPPMFEEINFHRTLTGNKAEDNQKFRRRIGSINEGHRVVAPYAHHIRLLVHNGSFDMAARFKQMCEIAGLAGSMIIRCEGPNKVEADGLRFFAPKKLYNLQNEFRRLPWSIAFQLESLLHNCLLHTEDLSSLLKQVQAMRKDPTYSERYIGALLRQYHEKLEVRSIRQSPLKCFAEVRKNFTIGDSTLPRGNFLCSHVTFTPTRMILEGPYATQSNRVIRMYEDYLDHFVRVDFRDEDRLQYRWDREVDGSTFLQQRVGGILKNGFELAGRSFEFLAYSSSSLREHAVWFMSPFYHPEKGQVDSEFIRQTLGDFKDTKLLRQPSKYAARLAQAFTATDPSVKIHKPEWEEVDDLGTEPYLFTDGVGTIAKSLGDEIWTALCAGRGDHGERTVQPSAYQIRFLGYKGVVGVDEQLDKLSAGIRMRLRKSMRKFSVSQVEWAEIEIAQSFEHPNTCYLNRPLIMILEDLGVRLDSFVQLQENEVAEALTINDSSLQFRNVLDAHSLGRSYRLSHLLHKLEELKLDLHARCATPGFDNGFICQIRQASMMDVLRDIKHNARLRIPESYLLVGVADEGPAYIAAGMENVYTLPEGHIFVCIQKSPKEEPVWLEGSCSISRSPVVHPGDIQRVRAIGKPPKDMVCLFSHMKNVVVLPSVGKRSLASQLGGGDLDGDQFSVIKYEPLLPSDTEDPADYRPANTWTIERDSTVRDICDFIVEYINSDVLGLLSDRLLVIADQSKYGIRDENCLWLAELCSQAVDYPKQGNKVDIDNDRLPRTLIRCKPDWHAAEVVSPRHTDYYESDRALGILYRSITWKNPETESVNQDSQQPPLTDPISDRLKRFVKAHLNPSLRLESLPEMFKRYVDELNYICATHVLSNTPGSRLTEAEVVAGTILAKCSQKRWRKDRIYRMRLHASALVRDVQRQLAEDLRSANHQQLVDGLSAAWAAWEYSHRQAHAFGAGSFGLIALGVIFDCLDRLGGIQVLDRDAYAGADNFEDSDTLL